MSSPWTASIRMGMLRVVYGQTNADGPYNNNLWWMDTFTLPAADFTYVSTTPPTNPANGVRYRVPNSSTGEWTGHDQEIAAYWDGVWYFAGKEDGWMIGDATGWQLYQSGWIDGAAGVTDIADLGQDIADPPTEAEVQVISDKVDEMLQKLRDANIIG